MKKYGLVGYPLTHSFSKKFFEEKFKKQGIHNVSYDNFPLSDLKDAKSYLTIGQGLHGFNVTIPHKKGIMPMLDEVSSAAKKIGACNCVRIEHGKWYGFNTDVIGFERSLKPFLKAYHSKALVLGTGGAAAAVVYVLDQLNIAYTYVSRSQSKTALKYSDVNEKILHEHLLIVNTTPVGMYPAIDEYPDIPYHLLTSRHHLYDLIYNPSETKFLEKGAAKQATIQNGYEMLCMQAEASWEIWNNAL